MALRRLLREAWHGITGAWVLSVLVVLVVASSAAAIAMTSGQSDVAQERVAAALDAPGFRVTTIAVDTEEALRLDALRAYAARTDVDFIVAVGPADDTKATVLGGGGEPFPIRTGVVINPRGTGLSLLALPADGRPGLYVPDEPDHFGIWAYSRRDGSSVPVAGTYHAEPDTFPGLNGTGLLLVDDTTVTTRTLYVVAPRAVFATQHRTQAPTLFGSTDVTVDTAADYQATTDAVRTELAQFSRYLVLGIAAASAALIALIVTVWSYLRQQELGRRRALGATQSTITVLAIMQVIILAFLGALIGVAIVFMAGQVGLVPAPSAAYQAATTWILLTAAATAATVPAALLSRRDPVRILRQP